MNLTVDDDFYIDDSGYVVITNPCDSNQDICLQPATEEDRAVYEQKCTLIDRAQFIVKKERVLNCIRDLVSDLVYYHRKEDEDGLPVGAIEDLLEYDDLSIDEMVETFRSALEYQATILAANQKGIAKTNAERRIPTHFPVVDAYKGPLK